MLLAVVAETVLEHKHAQDEDLRRDDIHVDVAACEEKKDLRTMLGSRSENKPILRETMPADERHWNENSLGDTAGCR
jgi:hypothetical protein